MSGALCGAMRRHDAAHVVELLAEAAKAPDLPRAALGGAARQAPAACSSAAAAVRVAASVVLPDAAVAPVCHPGRHLVAAREVFAVAARAAVPEQALGRAGGVRGALGRAPVRGHRAPGVVAALAEPARLGDPAAAAELRAAGGRTAARSATLAAGPRAACPVVPEARVAPLQDPLGGVHGSHARHITLPFARAIGPRDGAWAACTGATGALAAATSTAHTAVRVAANVAFWDPMLAPACAVLEGVRGHPRSKSTKHQGAQCHKS